jgi:hypothetical protein
MQRRTNAPKPVPVTPTTEQSPVPSSVDSGILSFGTSASANDERRRSIMSDVEETDKSCSKILDFTKLEKNIGEQGMKDRAHGYNENSSLFRGASEMLDSLIMSDQVRLGLEETLKGQLACKLNPQDSDGISFDNENDGVQQGGDKGNSPPTEYQSIHSIQNVHRTNLIEEDELSISEKQGLRVVGAELAKKSAVEEKVAASLAQTKAAGTLDRLVKAKENNKVYQKTLNEAIQRKNFAKTNLEAAQARSKQLESEEREAVSIYCCCLSFTIVNFFAANSHTARVLFLFIQRVALESKKKANTIKHNEKIKLLAAAKEKQQSENKLFAALEAELAGLTLQESNLKSALGSIDSLCRVREEKKRELEETRVERTALFAKSSDLGSKLTNAKASCDLATREILHSKEIQVEIEVEKATNDGIEFEKLVKGRAEFEELSKVKEEFSTLTNDFAQKNDDLFKGLDDRNKTRGVLQEDQSNVAKELEEKKAALLDHSRILDEHKVEFTKDFEAELALIKQHTEDASFERERIADIHKHDEFERKVLVLQFGAELLEVVREDEKQYAIDDDEF